MPCSDSCGDKLFHMLTNSFSGCQKKVMAKLAKKLEELTSDEDLQGLLVELHLAQRGLLVSYLHRDRATDYHLATIETTIAVHIKIHFTSRTDFKLLRCMVFFSTAMNNWLISTSHRSPTQHCIEATVINIFESCLSSYSRPVHHSQKLLSYTSN